jgi:DMSO reductase anchor subunit
MNTTEAKSVANLEEIQPRLPSKWEDLPLILFTLLTQMAVGGYWAMLWTFPNLGIWQLLPFLLIGVCLGAGMLASLAHLGTKKNAWRALGNLRKSWLSREVLFTGLFGASWLLTTLEWMIWQRLTIEWIALTATFGLGLVYSMSRVYRLPAVPAWNTWKTNAVFLLSALLLGQSFMAILLSSGSNVTGGAILILLLLQLLLMHKWLPYSPFHSLQAMLLLAAMTLTVINFISPDMIRLWSVLIFLLVIVEESLGKCSFYHAVQRSF